MASKTDKFKKKNNTRTIGTIVGSIIILIIVVVSFVVAPALTDLGQTNVADIELGSYGKEKITFSFINETAFSNELAAISDSTTDSMDPRLAQVAYRRAVTKAAAREQFTSSGYSISDEQLDEAVLQSGYYNVNGSFNTEVFKNTTESQKQHIREEMARELQVQSWMYHTLYQQRRSNGYLSFISSMSNVKRNFNYVAISYDEYPDELVLEYGKNDAEKFTELSLSRITVDKMSTANDIIKQLENKESTFEDLAKKYSTDNFKDDGGKLSNITYAYELESIFGLTDSSELLDLKVGDKPIIIENDESVILLAVNEETLEPSFNELSIVRDYMLSFERGIIEDYFYNMINEISDNNLASLGKEIKETGLFSINFGGEQLLSTSIDRVNGDEIFTRAVSNENFFTTLFNLEADVLSEPIVLGDNITVFKLINEETDETLEDEYILSSLDQSLLNYKSQVSEDLFFKSDKYTDNFFPGYIEILQMTQGI